MRGTHQLPAAVEALRNFAERDCRDAEMRGVVADLLVQTAPAGDPDGALDGLLTQLRAREEEKDEAAPPSLPGQVRGLVFLDTDPDWEPTGAPRSGASPHEVEPVEGLNVPGTDLPAALGGLPIVGLEPAGFQAAEELAIEHLGGVDRDEMTFGDGPRPVEPDALIMLDTTGEDPASDLVGGATDDTPAIPLISLDSGGVEVSGDGPVLEVGADSAIDTALVEPAEDAAAGLGSGSGYDQPPEPSSPAEPEGESVASVEARLAEHEDREEWPEALAAAADLVILEPDQIPRYQKQVELAYRAGDRDALTVRYLELGDALLRAGMRAPAVAVYRRVLEHHPGQGRALGALASLGVAVDPPAPAPTSEPPARNDYVDLGALILDDVPAPDSRMKVEASEPEPSDDEDQTFRETLEAFKRGIEDNLDSEDFQSHYDLGIAFKEMGLLDEAIAQFQRALRSPEGRLKASEALGIAFFDKGRHAIAEAVLSRGVASLPGADDEKIGLIYWLGRALEAQGKEPEALPCYERALAVDIRFLDIADRISRLSAGKNG
jgi:tetratricopeptide (TPR) repeat protein